VWLLKVCGIEGIEEAVEGLFWKKKADGVFLFQEYV
jgi:hypothetical protein